MSETNETRANAGNVRNTIGNSLSKRRRALVGVGLFILVLAVAGVAYLIHSAAHESTDDAFIEGHVVTISPRVGGTVLAVHVTDNQPVRAGDLLVEIDPRDYQARLDQARAALLAAQTRRQGARVNIGLTQASTSATLDQATAGVQSAQAQAQAAGSRSRQAEAQVAAAQAGQAQARAQVAAAEAEAARADADLTRYRQLFDKDEISRQQLDHAVAAAKAADAQLEAARAAVAASEAEVGQSEAARAAVRDNVQVAEAGVREAQARLAAARTAPQQVALSESQHETAGAEIEQLQAAVRQAELELSYTRITAPAAGRVTRKSVEVGANVAPGQALFALVPADVWVVANFKETQLAKMRPGQIVDIDVDAYPDKSFHGHVDSIQAGTGSHFSLLPPENATGNYVKVIQRVPVKIVFDEPPDPAHLLAPGMSVVPVVHVK
jgi:membrane fusion protein (multidrug efflux system)